MNKDHLIQKTSRILWKNHSFNYDDLTRIKNKILETCSSVPKGAVIVSQILNHPVHFIYLEVCAELGLVYLPLDLRLTQMEVEQVISDLQPRLFVDTWDHNAEPRTFERFSRFSDLDQGGILLMTSGSSGRAKYIFHTYDNLLKNAQLAAHYQKLNDFSVSYVPLGLSHTGGMNMLSLPTIWAGGELRLNDGFSPKHFFFNLAELTHAVLVPSQIRVATKFSDRGSRDKEFRHLALLTGSTPIANSLFQWGAEFCPKMIGIYGMTEIGPFICLARPADVEPDKKFLLGRMIGEYRAKISEEGEILLAGTGMGRRVERSLNHLEFKALGSPWLCSGDLGDQIGDVLWLKGRQVNEINYGGLKFNAEEVEQLLLEIPGVLGCAVVGESHKDNYQVPVAYIHGEGVDEGTIFSALRGKLAHFKIPKKIYFVNDVPSGAIGKTNYSRFRGRESE